MAKKGKEVVPNINSVPNRDIIHRLSFLHQASAYLNGLESLTLTGSSPSNEPDQSYETTQTEIEQCSSGTRIDTNGRRQPKRKGTARDLSRNYAKSMKIIGLKTNTRLWVPVTMTEDSTSCIYMLIKDISRDPSVKRAICKACNAVLTPGVTAKIRTKRVYHTAKLSCPLRVYSLLTSLCSFHSPIHSTY